MIAPRLPLYLSHAPVPRVAHFAILAALEAGVRGILLSVMPIAIYRATGDGTVLSAIYLVTGVISLICGLMVPWATRHVPRRWMFTAAGAAYVAGMAIAILGPDWARAIALCINAVATVTFSVCLSAYVLDYITREDLGRNESTRMLFSAPSWTIGPATGVLLFDWWEPAPFLIAGAFAVAMTLVFWVLRLGNGKQIARARGPAPNPVAYLARFRAQPRLVAGWLFAVIRSCGWWVYVVYLPVYCTEAGLADRVAGLALSCSNGLLFATPLMLRIVRRTGVRPAVRGAFGLAAALFLLAGLAAPWPWGTVGALVAASVALVMLDVCGSLPFLMAVKPAERTEMAAVYSTFRDASGIATPAVAGLVLLVAPVSAVFAVCGLAMGAAWALAGRLHPRLGLPHVR